MHSSKKRGRPKKYNKKNCIVSTYLTEEENKKLKEKAKKNNLSAASFIRTILLEKIK